MDFIFEQLKAISDEKINGNELNYWNLYYYIITNVNC
jgi:hypothetical protein